MSSTIDDALSADEVIALLALWRGVDPPLLVGGQALNILARHYHVEGMKIQFSRDVDFVGDSEDARQAAQIWRAEIHLPTLDDHTPNTAILTIRRANKPPLTIDFLENVAGIVFGAEVPSLKIREGSVDLRVMHPLACLQSRLWNIYGPLARRNAREIERAGLAIRVLHAYLTEILDHDKGREALKTIERLVKYAALSRVGTKAWVLDRIDVLAAVPLVHPALPPAFQSTRWPDIQRRVDSTRATAERIKAVRPRRVKPEAPDMGTG